MDKYRGRVDWKRLRERQKMKEKGDKSIHEQCINKTLQLIFVKILYILYVHISDVFFLNEGFLFWWQR